MTARSLFGDRGQIDTHPRLIPDLQGIDLVDPLRIVQLIIRIVGDSDIAFRAVGQFIPNTDIIKIDRDPHARYRLSMGTPRIRRNRDQRREHCKCYQERNILFHESMPP